MLKKEIKIFALASVIILLVGSTSAAAFDGGSFYGGQEETETEISGEINPQFRIFADDGEINENLSGNLEINYPGETNEFKFLLDFKPGAVEEIEFNELYYKYYGDKYSVLIGKNRPIWGKGDQVHVVDNLNAEDMSDFINPDYKERQIGEEMIKIDRYFRGGNANLEFVYTPDFTPDRLPEDPESSLGNWIINPFSEQMTLSDLERATGYSTTEIINQVKDSTEEENNQFAIRFTDSRGGTDYGLSYYKGYLRKPAYNKNELLQLKNNIEAGNPVDLESSLNAADLHYDEVDVFGFELARVIADINSRFELAYYRTEDTDGTDPTIRNNKIAWVIGGDRDLPISNLNLNLQFTGEKILDDDQIEDNSVMQNGRAYNIDVQYNESGDYISNRAILQLEDSYKNGKIIPELIWVYNLNENDYTVEAAVDYELKQDLILTISHKIFRGDEDTTFGQFEDNDYSSLTLNYSF